MRNHTVEIGDRNGKSFRIHVSTPGSWEKIRDGFAGKNDEKTAFIEARGVRYETRSKLPMGQWRTIDKGFIRYNNGTILVANAGKDLTTHEIYMVNLTGEWGIHLWDYEDATGVNDAGRGSVIQPWTMNIGVGGVSWTLLD